METIKAVELDDNYEILEPLVEGGQAVTYLARDTLSGEKVILKKLPSHRMESIHAVEAFEREIEVLASLEHPQLPSYLASTTPSGGRDNHSQDFVLVQEYVEGPTLGELIEEGRRWTDEQIREMADQLLEILVYLQTREPPVIHRDIKPANIISSPDGKLHLVDFGAVDWFESGDVGGETMVGTTGYMAPEQFTGRAVPGTDLYSLGATLIHAASHRHPSELQTEQLQLEFSEYVDLTEQLELFLEILVRPSLEERFKDAEEAGYYLQNLEELSDFEPGREHTLIQRRGPRDTDVEIQRTESFLQIDIPPQPRIGYIVSIVFTVACLTGAGGFLAFVGEGSPLSVWNFWLVYVPLFIGLYWEVDRLKRVRLKADGDRVEVERGFLKMETKDWSLGGLQEVSQSGTEIVAGFKGVREGLEWMFFNGSITVGKYLSNEELEWIESEVRGFLEDHGRPDAVGSDKTAEPPKVK